MKALYKALYIFTLFTVATCHLNASNLFMENNLLKLTIIPNSNGRISQINFIPKNINLMKPYSEKTLAEDPLLPLIILSNRSGFKEWLWGKSPVPNCNMKVIESTTSTNESQLELFSKYHMSQDVSLNRKMILNNNSSQVILDYDIKNINKKNKTIALWLNSIPEFNGKMGKNIFPVAGGIKHQNGRSVLYSTRDKIVETNNFGATNYFVAPARPWVAKVSPEDKIVLAFKTSIKALQPNGLFYSWSGLSDGKKITTQELIVSPKLFKANESKKYHAKIMVFNGLTSLKEICHNIGIDCNAVIKNEKVNLTLSLSACEIIEPTLLTINLKPIASDKIATSSSHSLNTLVPGKAEKLSVSLPIKSIKPGNYQITGSFGKNMHFKLLDPLITVK